VFRYRRYFFAAIFSILGIAASKMWYEWAEKRAYTNSSIDSIAYIQNPVDEIKKKSSNRQLWIRVENNDPLQNGDTIQTSSQGEVRIVFANGDRVLDLEPDSMIVLNKDKGEISLDLLEGSLMVKAENNEVDENQAPEAKSVSIKLKTKEGKVDLSKATAKLSGSTNAGIDLKILKGKAELDKGSGKKETLSMGRSVDLGVLKKSTIETIKIIYPTNDQALYINPQAPKPISLKWQGAPENSEVVLESGISRKTLTSTVSKTISANELQSSWSPGKRYWKLVAKNPITKAILAESSIFRNEVISRIPPQLTFPKNNALFKSRTGTENIKIQWAIGSEYKSVQLDIFNDAKAESKLLTKVFKADETSYVFQTSGFLTYTYRVTGFFEGTNESMSSVLNQFTVSKLEILRLPIAWSPSVKEVQYFVGETPKINLDWQTTQPEKVAKWKLTLSSNTIEPAYSETIETNQLKFEKSLVKQGRYLASVEGFDSNGDSIGTTPTKILDIKPLPLLKSPLLLPANSTPLNARTDGSYVAEWLKPESAKQFKVSLKNNQGKIISEETTDTNTKKFTGLLPGEYTVSVRAIDEFGRASENSTDRKLIVPDKSDVKAPKLKTVKVQK
jgi:hypothetical protein